MRHMVLVVQRRAFAPPLKGLPVCAAPDQLWCVQLFFQESYLSVYPILVERVGASDDLIQFASSLALAQCSPRQLYALCQRVNLFVGEERGPGVQAEHICRGFGGILAEQAPQECGIIDGITALQRLAITHAGQSYAFGGDYVFAQFRALAYLADARWRGQRTFVDPILTVNNQRVLAAHADQHLA